MAEPNAKALPDRGGSRSGVDRRRKKQHIQNDERSGVDRRVRPDRRKTNGRRRKVVNGDPPERRDAFKKDDSNVRSKV